MFRFTFRRIIPALLLALTAALAPAAAQADTPPGAVQWTAKNLGSLKTATPMSLVNTEVGKQLGYGNRTFGIDLDWTSSGGRFEFRAATDSVNIRDHRRRAVTETENVSLYNTKTKRYVVFKKRGVSKAELEWSKTQSAQWQVHAQSGAKFALFNTQVGRYLDYQFKNYGINLGWFETATTAPVQSFSVALSPQPVVQGFIPFAGSFGGGTQGKLLTVQNASDANTLRFVKPGKSTADCASADATITVAPRASLTADQLKTLYGSATPRLPVNFLACVSSTLPNVGLTFLNITYQLDR